ncbi:MAG TPA: LEPR-XLL domain-containing protein, partial [Phycisphaerae bacterium]
MHMTERGGRSAKWRGLEVLESRVLLSGDVLTNHNGGANLGDYQETILTPTSIASSQAGSSISTNFGRTFSTTLDGNVYA